MTKKRDNKMTEHHILQKSSGGSNHPLNKLAIDETRHRALHTLFPEEVNSPILQLSYLFDLTKQTLQHDTKHDIEKILQFWAENGRDAYKEECIKDVQKIREIY